MSVGGCTKAGIRIETQTQVQALSERARRPPAFEPLARHRCSFNNIFSISIYTHVKYTCNSHNVYSCFVRCLTFALD